MIVQSIGVQCAEEESEPKVTLSPKSYIYDGKRKKPTVTVKVGKTVLKKGRDYTVSVTPMNVWLQKGAPIQTTFTTADTN